MDVAKVYTEMKVLGQFFFFHEITNCFSVEEGTNIVSKDIVLQGKHCGRVTSNSSLCHIIGLDLLLPLSFLVLFNTRHDEQIVWKFESLF